MKLHKWMVPLLLIGLTLPSRVRGEAIAAREISGPELVTARAQMGSPNWLFNGDTVNWMAGKKNMSLTLTSREGIGSLYLIFGLPYGEYRICNEDTGREITWGKNGFLHDFVDLKEAFGEVPQSVTLRFGEEGPKLSELRVFTEGEPPKDVQRWKKAPEEGVDLLVFPAHGDDEQLFFAGLLPYYAGQLQYEVQVAYSTDHHNWGSRRPHEMLDGLWAVGVRNYPVFGPFPDFLTRSEDRAIEAIKPYGFSEEDVLGFAVEQLRKFKPLVVVGHDLGGEYGHGFHRLYGHMVARAGELSVDPRIFPESAEKYGVWDVPKLYLHMYGENQVHMNWDVPLSEFDGMTAYQVTKELGYPAHKSQYDGFAWYFADRDRAEQVKEHSPCIYGLYRTTAGEDQKKDDLFENLTCRRELQRMQIEGERKAAAKKAEAARIQKLQQLEAERQEAEALRIQKADKEAMALQSQAAAKQLRLRGILRNALLGGILSFLALVLLLFRRLRKRK